MCAIIDMLKLSVQRHLFAFLKGISSVSTIREKAIDFLTKSSEPLCGFTVTSCRERGKMKLVREQTFTAVTTKMITGTNLFCGHSTTLNLTIYRRYVLNINKKD